MRIRVRVGVSLRAASPAHTHLDDGHALLPTLLDKCFLVDLLPVVVVQTADQRGANQSKAL